MKAQNYRAHNLSTKQPNVQDNQPANDGYKEDLTDPSDKIRVGVTNGKSGEITTRSLNNK